MQRESLVLLSTREKLVLHSKGKIGAAQQREIWCCWAEREIWCCWAKRNLVQRAQEKIGAAQYLVQREEESWCEPKEAAACGSELSSEFAQLISKRDYALKPLVHIKNFLATRAYCEAESEKRVNSPNRLLLFLIAIPQKFPSQCTHTLLRHTIYSFDWIDYFVQIAHLHTLFSS